MAAEAGAAYGDRLKRFCRQVIHVRPGVFVICDDLAATRPATFQWLLHAYDKFEVDAPQRLLTIQRQPATMEVRLLLPAEVTFTQTDRYDPEPEKIQRGEVKNTWHLTAATPTPSPTSRFLAVFTPYHADGPSPVTKTELLQSENAVGVRLQLHDGAEDLVVFRTGGEGATVTCGGLTSDGRVFGRGRAKDGTICRRLLFEGTRLSENGKELP